jgi:hypothetical protein
MSDVSQHDLDALAAAARHTRGELLPHGFGPGHLRTP